VVQEAYDNTVNVTTTNKCGTAHVGSSEMLVYKRLSTLLHYEQQFSHCGTTNGALIVLLLLHAVTLAAVVSSLYRDESRRLWQSSITFKNARKASYIHQDLLKAKYCPRVAAASCTQKKNAKETHVTLIFCKLIGF